VNGYEGNHALQGDRNPAGISGLVVTPLTMGGDHDKIVAAQFDGYIAKPNIPKVLCRW
jgi:hypothetical protein